MQFLLIQIGLQREKYLGKDSYLHLTVYIVFFGG